MNVGFTGTQKGMTDEQLRTVGKLLLELRESENDRFHHGDCVGADVQAARVADDLGYAVVAHPAAGVFERKRGNYEPVGFNYRLAEQRFAKHPLERNKDIVASCDVLIAAPFEQDEQLRSGTWMTVRYANKVGRRVELVDRDGNIREEWH